MKMIDMGRTKGAVRPIEPGTIIVHYRTEKPMKYNGPVEGPNSQGFDVEQYDDLWQPVPGIRCDLWKIAPHDGLVIPAKDARVVVNKPGTIISTRGAWLLTFDGEQIGMFERRKDAMVAGLKLAAISDWHGSVAPAEPLRTAEQAAPARQVTVTNTRLSIPTQIFRACDDLGLDLGLTRENGGALEYVIDGGKPVTPRAAADYLIDGGFDAACGASELRIHPDRLVEAKTRSGPVAEDDGLAEMFAELLALCG
jgi:hypothetical protein